MKVAKLRQMIASFGLVMTADLVCKAVYRRLRPPPAIVHPFDTRHGVDTSGLILPEDVKSEHEHARHKNAYWGTAPSFFSGLMEQWQARLPNGASVRDYAVVDIGCGKGRVLMLASEFPFREVAGVELSAELAQIAERNLALWMTTDRTCQSVRAFEADALAYDLPSGPLLIYLFSPFDGDLMGQFVDRIMECAASRQEPVDVLYVSPSYAGAFSKHPSIDFLGNLAVPFSAEDSAADVFGRRQETCNLYRIPAGAAKPGVPLQAHAM
jgi:SAM-dependent methyltransferase